MTRKSIHAPLYIDAFSLCEWLIGRLGDDSRELARAICRCALELLDAITLALTGRRREEHVEIADERLITLRHQLRLAAASGYLSESQLVFAIERADSIGRQLGGWMHALGPV